MKKITFVIDFLDRKWNNPIGFATLIPLAAGKGAEVYFFDNAREMEPESPEGVKHRNTVMGEVFQEFSKGDEPGAVLLNGRFHLFPGPSGGLYEHTVQHTCGIRFQHCADLGRFS